MGGTFALMSSPLRPSFWYGFPKPNCHVVKGTRDKTYGPSKLLQTNPTWLITWPWNPGPDVKYATRGMNARTGPSDATSRYKARGEVSQGGLERRCLISNYRFHYYCSIFSSCLIFNTLNRNYFLPGWVHLLTKGQWPYRPASQGVKNVKRYLSFSQKGQLLMFLCLPGLKHSIKAINTSSDPNFLIHWLACFAAGKNQVCTALFCIDRCICETATTAFGWCRTQPKIQNLHIYVEGRVNFLQSAKPEGQHVGRGSARSTKVNFGVPKCCHPCFFISWFLSSRISSFPHFVLPRIWLFWPLFQENNLHHVHN